MHLGNGHEFAAEQDPGPLFDGRHQLSLRQNTGWSVTCHVSSGPEVTATSARPRDSSVERNCLTSIDQTPLAETAATQPCVEYDGSSANAPPSAPFHASDVTGQAMSFALVSRTFAPLPDVSMRVSDAGCPATRRKLRFVSAPPTTEIGSEPGGAVAVSAGVGWAPYHPVATTFGCPGGDAGAVASDGASCSWITDGGGTGDGNVGPVAVGTKVWGDADADGRLAGEPLLLDGLAATTAAGVAAATPVAASLERAPKSAGAV